MNMVLRRIGILILAAIALPLVPASGQTSFNLVLRPCNALATAASGPVIQLTVPVSIGGVPVMVPVCAALGAGFSYDPVGGKLSVTLPTSTAALPTVQIDTFPLDLATPLTTTTASFTLKKTPAATMPVIVMFHSSAAGGNVDAAAVPSGQSPSVTVTLPTYRPFTADDVVTVVYWSF